MCTDANSESSAREAALAQALAAAHDAYAAKLALIESEQAAGGLAPELAAPQARAAQAVYERDCELARIADEFPGWETFVGVNGLLYARRPLTSPPWLVRAPSPQALREAITAKAGPR